MYPPSPPLQGMMSRVLYETVIVLVMVAVLVLGLLQWVMDTLTSGQCKL